MAQKSSRTTHSPVLIQALRLAKVQTYLNLSLKLCDERHHVTSGMARERDLHGHLTGRIYKICISSLSRSFVRLVDISLHPNSFAIRGTAVNQAPGRKRKRASMLSLGQLCEFQ